MDFKFFIEMIIAFGGIELLRWGYNVYISHEKDKAVNKAEADKSQFEILKQIDEFLQQQLKEKEERFVDQTKRLRETQDCLFQERQEKAELEIKLQQAELWRCNIKMCGKREPPNGM